jgi:hypothetical protein
MPSVATVGTRKSTPPQGCCVQDTHKKKEKVPVSAFWGQLPNHCRHVAIFMRYTACHNAFKDYTANASHLTNILVFQFPKLPGLPDQNLCRDVAVDVKQLLLYDWLPS